MYVKSRKDGVGMPTVLSSSGQHFSMPYTAISDHEDGCACVCVCVPEPGGLLISMTTS